MNYLICLLLLFTPNHQQLDSRVELERVKVGQYLSIELPVNPQIVDTLVINGFTSKIGNSVFSATEVSIDSMDNIRDLNSFIFHGVDSLHLLYDVTQRKFNRSSMGPALRGENVMIDSMVARKIVFSDDRVNVNYAIYGKFKEYSIVFNIDKNDSLDYLADVILNSAKFELTTSDQYLPAMPENSNTIYWVMGVVGLLVFGAWTQRSRFLDANKKSG